MRNYAYVFLATRSIRLLVGSALLVAAPLFAGPDRVEIVTTLGNIEVELYPSKAPGTVLNFLRYVERGDFNGGQFHRTVTPQNQPSDPIRIEVIQASVRADAEAKEWAPIPLERTRDSGVRHVDGAISMARDGPNTATSSFFICIGDQPELDFDGRRNPDRQGFAAFGRVTSGMDVVRRIQQSTAVAQELAPPIRILRLTPRFD